MCLQGRWWHRYDRPPSSAISLDRISVGQLLTAQHSSGGPALSRRLTSQLSALTKSRILVPRYRLAPEHAFPAQLYDALIAYLSLIHPPPGSFHKAVPPPRIVLAAESCGASVAVSLALLLAQLDREASTSTSTSSTKHTLHFHGAPLPSKLSPAGLSLLSLFLMSCPGTPRFWSGIDGDILLEESQPQLDPRRPMDPGVWPAEPPRAHVTGPKAAALHPLVDPLFAPQAMWVGVPPVSVAMGGAERCRDAAEMALAVARRAGVSVRLEVFEGMCHCWVYALAGIKEVSSVGEGIVMWARGIVRVQEGDVSWMGRRVLVEEGTLKEVQTGWTPEFEDGAAMVDMWKRLRMAVLRDPIWYGPTAVAGKAKANM